MMMDLTFTTGFGQLPKGKRCF